MGLSFSDIGSAVAGYNPITMATDAVTGGAASQALGLDNSAYQAATGQATDLGNVYEDLSGQTAADAASAAGATQASAMMEQLAYLQEVNKLPQQYREQALTELAGLYGEGGASNQQAMIDRAKQSPLYQEIMGGQKAGEEAVMRNAAQTGGLRSGNVQSAMYDYSTQLQNQALTQSYDQQLQGLQGLAGIQTNENRIGQTMSDIGTTQANSILAQSGARQQGTENIMNLGFGIAGLAAGI